MGCGRQVLGTVGGSGRLAMIAVAGVVYTGLAMGLATVDIATQRPAAAQQTLPPPPSLPPLEPSDGFSTPPQNTFPVPGERIYTPPTGGFVQPIAGQYRVYVASDSPYLLEQIRTIEPGAFLQTIGGRRVIQTGTFNSEANARQQVASLASRGVRAEITTLSGGQIPPEGGQSPSGYYAIVPGSERELPLLRDRAIQLGVAQDAIRLRDRPIGFHMAVGPYATRRDAEIVQQFLRDRQFDARVFYDR
ncbi:SPOR domain-containing protein [Myxacorys almedinensis]|uniref:SPOR domain-containing protein n=1 Tax=Myxacorys almedinensis A TaxID=2690445 RepID=A0A8J7Z2F6_9CYAN|nr:SPOR domain-containing protein [Myxacorys almedinensis]NDJ18444.1 hypothetical protein [Myxacorys almedinensis A]